MKLRAYQEQVIEKARSLLRSGRKKIIIQAATGSGKTIVAAAIVSAAIEKSKKVLFLVHFRQLAYQAIERFTEFGIGDMVGLIMAGEDSFLSRPVQVAMVQTYSRRLQLPDNRWFCDADLVIYDECHASIAKTRKAVLELYKENAVIIGLTATPCRADGRGLGEVYEDIVECISIESLTKEGHLVPVIYYGCKELPDLNNIPIVAGDYNKKVLGERVDKPKLIGDIYDNWARIAHDRQTVIFATNVKHSKHIKELFQSRGVPTEHIDAHSPEEERQDVLKRFKNGDVQVVTNVGVFSEGADFPWASCVVLARPSKSYARFVQMAGRGLRPFPGKDNCIVIDHAGLVHRHGFLDDPVEWKLDGKEIAWKKKVVRKKEKKIFECDECRAQFVGHRCPTCGWEVPEWGKKVQTTEDELEEIGKNRKKFTTEEKRKFYGMLEFRRRMKGYSHGWSAHKFKEKFGVWPNHYKDQGPIEPDQSFLNWEKYQIIKWVKSKQKREKQMEIAA